MASTSTVSRTYDRLATQRNVTILVAILVAIPTSYAFTETFGGSSGDFLLLVTLAVGVPTAYDEYWPKYERTRTAVGWILVTCVVAAAAFTAVYLVGTELLSLSPFLAGVGAFLVTDFGGLVLLARWHRARE